MRDWIREAEAELSRLTPPHVTKKRATIIALVDARLAGHSEEKVWKRRDTCSRKTYHTKWKRDPLFASVLERVTALARSWQDTQALQALRDASEQLAMASPRAVEVAVQAMEEPDPNVRLRAAFGILDRADVTTAAKTQNQELRDEIQEESPRERLARRIARMAERLRTDGAPDGSE